MSVPASYGPDPSHDRSMDPERRKGFVVARSARSG